MSDADDVTRDLASYVRGDRAAGERVLHAISAELRELAERALRHARKDHTLQPTALVHEAWLKLAKGSVEPAKDRAHLLALAATAMRSILIDHARRRCADKRDGGARLALDAVDVGVVDRAQTLLTVDDELRALAEVDAELARIVELRFFGGLSIDETADAMAVSTPTVERGWRTARAWLAVRLRP